MSYTFISCSEDTSEELVTFSGQLNIYDFENSDSDSDWLPIPNKEISIYFIENCDSFNGVLLGTTTSNNEGYYEIVVPQSQTAISYLSNGDISYDGCHRYETDNSYSNYAITEIARFSNSERYIQTRDFYFGRESRIYLDTSSEELDSVFVKIDNSNGLIHELISSGNHVFYREEYQRPWWNVLGEEFSLSLPYDPKSTYEFYISKYYNGELEVEDFDFEISLNPEENIIEIR